MSAPANAARGEAGFEVGGAPILLRPSFAALVAAEAELGPLFALVERAAEGRLGIGEMASLFFHCAVDPSTGSGQGVPEGLTRERIGQAIAERGLAHATPALKVLLTQILQGRV